MGYPVSDSNQLYIEVGNFGTINMQSILEQACSHFGCVTIDEVVISPEDIKVEGCGCCYDASDYRLFLCVTIERD